MTAQGSVNAFFTRGGRPAAHSTLAAVAAAAPRRRFSVFLPQDLRAAVELAEQMATAATAAGDDEAAVQAALAIAREAEPDHPPGLTDHAAKLFLTHHRSARNVRIPNLMSRMAVRRTGVVAAAAPPTLGGVSGSPDEDKLGWFREDPLANEHHEHWHLVYVNGDTPTFRVRPRHGELFFYMHQQMLARYDTERLAAGVARVQPFADYGGELIAYNPGAMEIGDSDFQPRAAGNVWRLIGPPFNYSPNDHAVIRDRFLSAVTDLALQAANGAPPIALDGANGSDRLGDANEPTSRSPDGGHYGNHHGMGHILTAALSNPQTFAGVMSDPAAAIRDPFFWQWHKHVDDINAGYQAKLAPHVFDDAPAVAFGGGATDAGLAIFDTASLNDAARAAGLSQDGLTEALFGGDRFADDAPVGVFQIGQTPQGQPVTIELRDTLETELRQGVFQLETEDVIEDEPRFTYPYLWHPGYTFAVRVRSTSDQAQTVTVRLFLCPALEVDGVADATLNDRRLWIELDKFEAKLEPGEAQVLTRADTASTIVRRPVTSIQANPEFVRDLHYGAGGDDHPDSAACECGWPYHLLYPRGTKDGMRFALLAIVTQNDRLARQGQCGSMSFCAVTDEYPDAKPMGYPFDRPLAAPMADLVAANPSFALRFITIRER